MPKKERPVTVPPDSLAGDVGKSIRADLRKKLFRYAKARVRAVQMSDYIKSVSDSKALDSVYRALHTCGSFLWFRHYYRIDDVRLYKASFCGRHVLCPLCAIRRGAKCVRVYMDRLRLILEKHPTLKPYLVTFTVKDGSDLVERFNHLQLSMQTYQQTRRNALAGRRENVEVNKALGAVWSYEVKIGSGSGQWHPHCHAIWLCDSPPSLDKLSREWLNITIDSHVVDVTPFTEDDFLKGFLEVFKYALKFSELSLSDNYHAWAALSGRRMIGSFGLFRGVKIPEILVDDPVEDEPYHDLFFNYVNRAYLPVKLKGGKNA